MLQNRVILVSAGLAAGVLLLGSAADAGLIAEHPRIAPRDVGNKRERDGGRSRYTGAALRRIRATGQERERARRRRQLAILEG